MARFIGFPFAPLTPESEEMYTSTPEKKRPAVVLSYFESMAHTMPGDEREAFESWVEVFNRGIISMLVFRVGDKKSVPREGEYIPEWGTGLVVRCYLALAISNNASDSVLRFYSGLVLGAASRLEPNTMERRPERNYPECPPESLSEE